MSAPYRVQLSRKKGWRKPENTIVVARPSRWGNPFSIGALGRECAIDLYRDLVLGIWNLLRVDDRADWEVDVIYQIRNAWLERIGQHPTDAIRYELAGHNLACWCPLGQPCHGDILLELGNR